MPPTPPNDVDLSILRMPREDPPPRRPSSRLKWLAGVFAVGLVLVAMARLSPFSESIPEVDTVALRPIGAVPADSPLTASGYVVAQRQASVASKGTGRLEYLGISIGSRVKAGEIIARIEQADMLALQRQARARLEAARATLESAQAELQDAQLAYGRAKALLSDQFISQSEFDVAANRLRKAEASVRSASAAIAAAEADVLTANVMVENTNIRAPFDGTVLKKFAEVGEIVAPMAGSTNARGAVALIGDLETLAVEVDISESALTKVAPDYPAEITLDALPGARYRGIVEQIVPTADRSKGTVSVKIRLIDRDDRILPEMSAKVFFRPDHAKSTAQPRFVVPSSSLIRRQDRTIVYVVENEVAREVSVEEVGQNGDDCEVLGPLTASAAIILSPPPSLTDGSRVRSRLVRSKGVSDDESTSH